MFDSRAGFDNRRTNHPPPSPKRRTSRRSCRRSASRWKLKPWNLALTSISGSRVTLMPPLRSTAASPIRTTCFSAIGTAPATCKPSPTIPTPNWTSCSKKGVQPPMSPSARRSTPKCRSNSPTLLLEFGSTSAMNTVSCSRPCRASPQCPTAQRPICVRPS